MRDTILTANAAAEAFPGRPAFAWDYLWDVMTFPKSSKTKNLRQLVIYIGFGKN